MKIIILTVISKHICICKLAFVKQKIIPELNPFCCFMKKVIIFFKKKTKADPFLMDIYNLILLHKKKTFQLLNTADCLF